MLNFLSYASFKISLSDITLMSITGILYWFAIKIQEKANELYPGLFKPIILRNSRYNQHLGKAACIIEVGATGNTLEETINSMKYLSKVMEEALK